MMAFIHNYAILKPNSFPNRLLMSDWRCIVALFIGCNLTVACLINVMLDTMFIDRDVAVRNVLQSLNNSGIASQSEVYGLLLVVHEKEPTMNGYQISRPITIVYLAVLCTILSVYTNTTITMNLKIRQHFKQTRDWVHSSTERLQIMVYRAFVRTTLCLLIFNYLPFSAVMLTIIGLISNYYVAMVASCVISFLAPVSILNIIWTIGPYRRAAKQLIFKAIGKEMRDETKINTIENILLKTQSKI
ncbi:serpentine type 7TM GPCR chemoreceptor srh domain-containing protein [Ditylenchus destructor]|uniref:Serpentine type 7TM GPCR chemoreceptor srh domain-containing protein n=1 Tax=Ditylenchus destructor TaxID=166010 RepID=A0AAD4R2B5_9BILA|nr:serpentine type 7TM GPCR chemoreceptor srh domain-containing protein [Ditylenchus destructor]